MSAAPEPASDGEGFAVEATEAGLQTLVPGVVPVTLGDRLAVLAAAPLVATKRQRPADHGLFDTNARNQLEMF
ncbi:hypothetical protein [Porphyrobacter sp. ULC335]|uniref:hypothetical protein n=1 Tax=Porphyrobacter sp. ULC335 TaxID=2854260 RepID=UPI00222035BC|nr:hypothetical protein [Porphyrobacter sp. ULC335]UYV16669.1 hypothetical protein KVF90_04930 [Porphyrobacter sp. ULC335]